jgi:serine/threonine protein kinase
MSDLSGRTLNAYQLIDEIDDSGSALVYQGFQPEMNRYVAVKILKPSAARNPETVERFTRQGALVSQIQNPRILEVFETDQAEGMHYRAMRLAENHSLREHRDWFMNPQASLALFGEIAEGLEVIHTRGFVHGNLKPSNILLTSDRHVLLTDFGLPVTPPVGQAPPYLAPEQVQGGVVDKRSDVYALGVLLFETLVGEAPSAGVVVSAHARRSDLPQAVDQVIFKSMAQNPEQRFQSPLEFMNALRNALTIPEPQPVYPPPPPTPSPVPSVAQSVTVQREGKSGSGWVALSVGAIILIGLCVGAFLLYWVFMGGQNTAPSGPTQPPSITQVLPTQEPRPTRQPLERPTRPPEQPTESAPENDQPIYPPPNESAPGGGLPQLPICGSTGFIGGALLLGGVYVSLQRQKGRKF